MPPSITIGPMRIDVIDSRELTHQLMSDAADTTKTHQVVTANAQFYNLAVQRREFRQCIADAEYVCADGISVVLACKWIAKTDVKRVPGVDLVEQICARAASSGHLPYFLGGLPGSASEAVKVLTERYPGFVAAGMSCPPRGFEKDPKALASVLEDIRTTKPDIIFVALGAPRQELFIQNHIRPLCVPVAIGVGGSFEMIAGRVHRAPNWMRRYGLEWAYRWAQEPRRLANRYLVGNIIFCFYLACYLLRINPSKSWFSEHRAKA